MQREQRADWAWAKVAAVLLVGLLASATATELHAQGFRFDMLDDTNLPGSDYKNFPVQNDNLYACVDACRQDAQCKSFTYVKAGVQGPQGRCWLKNAVPGKAQQNCCISGVKFPETLLIAVRRTWQQDGINLPGADYRSFTPDTPSASACSAACANDNKCSAFTYVKPNVQGPGARCWLKTSIPQAQANGCCASGIVEFGAADLGQVSMEPTTDRLGLDYKGITLPTANVMLCASACASEAACRAYTYTAPGVKGPSAMCFLKNGVPAAKGNACCASGLKAPDSGQNTPLARGKALTAAKNCQTTAVQDIFDKICSVIPNVGCGISKQSCGTYSRQIYVGSTFSAATQAELAAWNGLGGRGALLGEGVMCALRELSPKMTIGAGPSLGGPVESGYSGNMLLGDVSLTQKIGFLKFDPATLQFDGYRNLRFCAPVVGCYDAVSQDVRIKLDRVKVNPPLTAGAGGPKLDQQLVLTVTTETSDKALYLLPPAFVVATPIGPVSVQPRFDYAFRDSVIDSPFQTSSETVRPAADEPGWARAGRVKDLYGVDYGIAFPYIYPVHAKYAGWLSPLALGNRDPSEGKSAWAVGDQRPDRDLTTARSGPEKIASTEVTAKAKVTYPDGGNLGSLIPSWIKDLGGDIKLSMFVEPTLRAAFSGQLHVLAAEGSILPGDIGAGGTWNGSDVALLTGVGGTLGFKLNTGLDLVVSFPVVGKVIDTHPRWPIDVGEGPSYRSGEKVYLASAAGPWTTAEPRTYTHIKTFKTPLVSGPQAANAYPYVQACLAPNKPVPEEPPPTPGATPGDPSKLFTPEAMEWPCNVCVFATGKGSGLLFQAPRPASARPWYCDMQAKSGCHDMCRFNPATKQLSFLRGPDKNLKIGNETGDPLCYTKLVR